MSGFLSEPLYMPCPECGESVARNERDEHACDPVRRVDFELLQARGEIAAFDEELGEYLASPQGRFASWYAERDRD